MPEFTRFGRRPTGDIRNYPRKDTLENALLNFSTDKFEPEKILIFKNILKGIDIEKIYIFGSWGRGTAIPFISDLDVYFILNQFPSGDKQYKIDIPLILKTNFIVFNTVEIFPATSEIDTDSGEAINNLIKNLGSLTYQEPHIAYNLTDRQDIFLENDKIKGLGL